MNVSQPATALRSQSIGVWLLGSVKAFEEEAEFDSAFFDAVKVEFTREARTRHGMELVGYKTRVLLTELAGWGAQFPERTVDDLSRALEAGDFLGDDGDEYYHDRGYVDDDVKYIAVALGESPPPSDDARDSGEEEDNDEEEQGDDEEGLEEPDEYDLEDSFIAGGRGGDSSSSSSDDDDDNDEDAAARLRRVRGRRVVSSSSSSSSSSASGNEDDDEEPPVGRE